MVSQQNQEQGRRQRQVIPITQLRPFDDNPRLSENPNKMDIYESIENRGLDQPFTVGKRRPSDDFYTIWNGGGTRLEILNELYEKYTAMLESVDDPDERENLVNLAHSFYFIECEIKDWLSDYEAFAGHMSENSNRGSMLFIEKAMAIQKAREYFVHEEGEGGKQAPRTNVELSLRLKELGWIISDKHITRMDYAAERYYTSIPNLFWAGAGEPLVRKLRKLEVASERVWHSINGDTASGLTQLRQTFFSVLSARDDDANNFNEEKFKDQLCIELAPLLNLSKLSLSSELNAYLNTNTKTKTASGGGSSSVVNELSSENMSFENVAVIHDGSHYEAELGKHSIYKLAQNLAAAYDIPLRPLKNSKDRYQVLNLAQPLKPDQDSHSGKSAVWWRLFRQQAVAAPSDIQQLEQEFKKTCSGYLQQTSVLGVILKLELQANKLPKAVLKSLDTIAKRVSVDDNSAVHSLEAAS